MLQDKDNIKIPEVVNFIPLRDAVLFPNMIIPLYISSERSITVVEKAYKVGQKILGIFSMSGTEFSSEDIKDDVYDVGIVAHIIHLRRLGDGRIKLIIQGLARVQYMHTVMDEGNNLLCEIGELIEEDVDSDEQDVTFLVNTVKSNFEHLVEVKGFNEFDILALINDITEVSKLTDYVVYHLELSKDASYSFLEMLDPFYRLEEVNKLLIKEIELVKIQENIRNQAVDEVSKTQKEYFLKEQMYQIKKELGQDIDEVEEFIDRIQRADMPDEAEAEALKQASRLESMNGESAEANVIRSYLDVLVDLPWNVTSEDVMDIKKAGKVLDSEHYGLHETKDRILEFLSVKQLKNSAKGPILCLIGPPGVGKTSIARSIANSLNREYLRMSLGGVRDEAEIRGHRRTYIGAQPGKIIDSIKKAGTNNPVFVLDELDKLGSDFRGDPSSALLEVLDPEQNDTFKDHYLNIPFDLSKVFFVATANRIDTIPGPLRDRLEIINVEGYTLLEKLQIAKKFLVKKQLKEKGFVPKEVTFTDGALKEIIAGYTRESGVRNLEKTIGKILRKIAREKLEGSEDPLGERGKYKIGVKDIETYLKASDMNSERYYQDRDRVGVVNGLAWTQFGGQMLYLESVLVPSKRAGNLIITGQLGDVMKESAKIALSVTKKYVNRGTLYTGTIKTEGIELSDAGLLDNNDIHIHAPEGAIPKDGPSAGVALVTSLVSLLTNTKIRKDVAMTGEVTLNGKVLPIGGLKEKLLAANRNGIKTVIIPNGNAKNLKEIPDDIKKGLEIFLAKEVGEVLKIALKD